MADDTHCSISLPLEAATLVWQLWGVGGSPFRPPLSHELVEPWVRDRVSCRNQATTFDEIRSWFHLDTEQWVLRDELQTPVALLILHSIERDIVKGHINLDDDTAFWAIGSIRPGLAEGIIRSQWDSGEVQIVVNYALEILDRLCKRNRIVDPERIVRFGGARAEVTGQHHAKTGRTGDPQWSEGM